MSSQRKKYLKEFLLGTGIGLIVPMIGLFIYWLFTWRMYSFIPEFFQYMHEHKKVAAHIALACILNLPLLYVSMNKDKYKLGQGIIFGTLFYAFYIFYYKLFL